MVATLGAGNEQALDESGRHPKPPATANVNPRTLMLVSADAGLQMRRDVVEECRPCPEFLRLEQRFGVEILDWSRTGLAGTGRSIYKSFQHALKAVSTLREFDVVFTDGEHIGIPLALAMCAGGLRTPHLMIAHNPTSRAKRSFLRLHPVQSRISRILIHSASQFGTASDVLAIPVAKLKLTAYGVDTGFWCPEAVDERALLVAPGRDHRDHQTLATACRSFPHQVFVTGASAHSPNAAFTKPLSWPTNFHFGTVDYIALRQLYREATLVVVPLLPGDTPAGITTVLEAMAVGKAVIASDTAGLRGVIEHGVTGLLVPPGDAAALHAAILQLISAPYERARLGANARKVAAARCGLDTYCDALAGHLQDLVRESKAAFSGK